MGAPFRTNETLHPEKSSQKWFGKNMHTLLCNIVQDFSYKLLLSFFTEIKVMYM